MTKNTEGRFNDEIFNSPGRYNNYDLYVSNNTISAYIKQELTLLKEIHKL